MDQALAWAQTSGITRLEAQLLMLHTLSRPLKDRAWVYIHEADQLDPDQAARFKAQVSRRLHHEPLSYITGEKEFFGLPLHVDARVLDPRADTETLVEWGLELLHSDVVCAPGQRPDILDLGCGSGAIALAIKANFKNSQVSAVDQSPQALEVAKANARSLGMEVRFECGSWFEPFSLERFDLVLTNPPYIDAQDPHLALLQHEPLSALVSHDQGLGDIQEIIKNSPHHLKSRGWLLIEHGFEQAQRVTEFLQAAGFEQIQTRFDLAGKPRCTGGQLKSVK
jgi:release factor glutamine methyltransferase